MNNGFQNFRLPNTIIPKHYDLWINPSFLTLTFEGKVSIDLSINQTTNQININSRHLKLKEILLKSFNNLKSYKPISALNSEIYKNEVIEIQFDEIIIPGNYTLEIQFTGSISEYNQEGFYWSKDPRLSLTPNLLPYSEEISLHTVLSTLFEPSLARTAFPCFDEPAFKATFRLNLVVNDKRMVAISNTECLDIKKEANFNTYCFNTTPKMSTYLIAWYIGYFDYI